MASFDQEGYLLTQKANKLPLFRINFNSKARLNIIFKKMRETDDKKEKKKKEKKG